MRLVLLPSPLVGPCTWAPVATWLVAQGHDALVVETGAPSGSLEVVEAAVATADAEPVVLVTHSNAGLYAPVLATLLDVVAAVHVDAALPFTPGTTTLAPPGLLEHLRGLADGAGLLPPWTEWWDDLGDLFPDEATRRAVTQRQPRLRLAYFESELPVPAGWMSRSQAYLAFGETYAEETAAARGHGWPVTVLPGRHLHQLHDPSGVGAEILRLLGRLGRLGRLRPV